VGLPNGDDSYNSLIRGQLRLSATERIRSLTTLSGIDVPMVLSDLVGTGTELMLVGRVAGAAHGWPITLGASDHRDLLVEVVPASLTALKRAAIDLGYEPVEQAQRVVEDAGYKRLGQGQWVLADHVRLIAHEQPGRTRGYADLARNADRFEIGGATLPVAALIDLIRIAEGDPGSVMRPFTAALWSTLEMTRRVDGEELARVAA